MLARSNTSLSEINLLAKNDIIRLDLLREWVRINSQTKNIGEVNRLQRRLREVISCLGGQSHFIPNEVTESGNLLVGDWKGKSETTVTLIAHADTVLPANSQINLYEDTEKLVAPGIADNKSGLFVALRGIEQFLKSVGRLNINLRFISSPNEEVGSPGFHNIFQAIGRRSDYLLGFEPSLEDGSIIHSRNGNRWYRIEVKGKSYHSGRAHKGHINVIHDLSLKIANLVQEFNQLSHVTFNVGEFTSGSATNVIPSQALAKVDTRFSCENGLESIINLMENRQQDWFFPCPTTYSETQSLVEIEDFCPALSYTDQSKSFTHLYLKNIKSCEQKETHSVHCGGAADINHFKNTDNIGIDGLGAIGGRLHCKDEYVLKSSLISRSDALTQTLSQLNNIS